MPKLLKRNFNLFWWPLNRVLYACLSLSVSLVFLAGCIPWDCKESYIAEPLNVHTCMLGNVRHIFFRPGCVLSCSVMSDSLQHYRLQPFRLLCPWDFPGKNTGVACHFLLQGIFPAQGSSPPVFCMGRWILCHGATWEGPCAYSYDWFKPSQIFFQSRDWYWNVPFKAHEVRGIYV